MHNVHQMATQVQTKLQLYLSMCGISVDVLAKEQMHDAERPVKCHTQSAKSAAFFKYAQQCTGHHGL